MHETWRIRTMPRFAQCRSLAISPLVHSTQKKTDTKTPHKHTRVAPPRQLKMTWTGALSPAPSHHRSPTEKQRRVALPLRNSSVRSVTHPFLSLLRNRLRYRILEPKKGPATILSALRCRAVDERLLYGMHIDSPWSPSPLCDVLSTWHGDLVRLRGETRNQSKAEIRGLLPSVSFPPQTAEYPIAVLIVEEARHKNKKDQRLLLVFFATFDATPPPNPKYSRTHVLKYSSIQIPLLLPFPLRLELLHCLTRRRHPPALL